MTPLSSCSTPTSASCPPSPNRRPCVLPLVRRGHLSMNVAAPARPRPGSIRAWAAKTPLVRCDQLSMNVAAPARPRSGSIRTGAAKTPSRASYCFPVAAVEDAAVLRAKGDGKTNDAWLSQTVAGPGPDRTGTLGCAPDARGQDLAEGQCQVLKGRCSGCPRSGWVPACPSGAGPVCGVGLFFQMQKNYAPEAPHPDDKKLGKAYEPSHRRGDVFSSISRALSRTDYLLFHVIFSLVVGVGAFFFF